MRTVQRAALAFSIFNLLTGILALFGPVLLGTKKRVTSNRPVYLMGLGAVNPPHGFLHSLLGLVGLIPLAAPGFSRPYIWLNAGIYSTLSALGWVKVGTSPAIHEVLGMAIDVRDNIIHTFLGASALYLSAVTKSLEKDG